MRASRSTPITFRSHTTTSTSTTWTSAKTSTGRFIYRKVLSPSLNPFGASTNSEGIYWIDCNGKQARSSNARESWARCWSSIRAPVRASATGRSAGRLPWPDTRRCWSMPTQPTNADFAINATNRALNEKENGINFNPAGAAHDEFGQDGDTNDIYRSAIRGLVAVRDDLTYQNRALVRGQVIVGDDITNSSGELEVEFLPDSLLNPPPGFIAPYTYIRRPSIAAKGGVAVVSPVCPCVSCQLSMPARICSIMQLTTDYRTH